MGGSVRHNGRREVGDGNIFVTEDWVLVVRGYVDSTSMLRRRIFFASLSEYEMSCTVHWILHS